MSSTTISHVSLLNSLTYSEFIASINTLFEPAPPLAQQLYAKRPFSSYDDLINIAESIVLGNELSIEEKKEIVNAHPRLGEKKEKLSTFSLREQGYNGAGMGEKGMDRASGGQSATNTENTVVEGDEVNGRLKELNMEYENKYGFRFVVFVNGRSRREIIPVFENRLRNGNEEEELAIGLRDMISIARDRLKKVSVE
ncbi:6595_t:CDS:1 [Paraglomus brasilianum]|uniref:6595_t:CDS:1 n=1 Tax=Paraglomus brasilianum TaxID=144538 RepID=A0A9N9AB26_9GLOM|nr:6595_t:CDS:1 [Paraglomus brasilianum]